MTGDTRSPSPRTNGIWPAGAGTGSGRTCSSGALPADLVDEALWPGGTDGPDAETEVERAVRVLNERGADLSDDRGRQRALGLLARRGYEAEEAYAAIRIAGRAA